MLYGDNGSDDQNRMKQLEMEIELLKNELKERELISEVLHENEQQFRSLIACIPGAVYRINIGENWIMDFISGEIENITGYPVSYFFYNSVDRLRDIIYYEDRERVQKTVEKGINNIDPFEIEYRITDSEGRIRWLVETGKALHSMHGEPMWLDGTIFDISDRKQTQISLEEANRDLKDMATIDGLTKIANRRYFESHFQKEWNRMLREQRMLSVIMCDIDYFKPYNDNYGHQKGDQCLYQIAQAIRSAARRSGDLVARFGGEEFIVVLSDTNQNGALRVASRIQKNVNNLKILHEYSHKKDIVTLSIGVSSAISTRNLDPQSLIRTADEALYQAKREGRNRVKVKNIGNDLPESYDKGSSNHSL